MEEMASTGLTANFMIYLIQVYHFDHSVASNIILLCTGVINCFPIVGAFVSESYLGKFKTIGIASCVSFLGLMILTMTAGIPQLHPRTCPPNHNQECDGPTSTQFAILILGLVLMAIGTGGIRPCSIPFAIDQFDATSANGRQGIRTFFNWFYTSIAMVYLISSTLIVYIQTKNWTLGFGLLCMFMLVAIIIFFSGRRLYFYLPTERGKFLSIPQVFVASLRKRHLRNTTINQEGVYYDPPPRVDETIKLPLTNRLEFLNKAAIIQGDLNEQGFSTNLWRLCSIQQVEEVKCFLSLLPIWVSGILGMLPVVYSGTFFVTQAIMMDKHIGGLEFEIPAASIAVVSLITAVLWLQVYNFYAQRVIAKITKQEDGLTCLQKVIIGAIFGVLTMLCAALVEGRRRYMAKYHNTSMSVMWLTPQYILLGFCEVFTLQGHNEFYNRESPERFRCLGNSLLSLLGAFSNYTGSIILTIVNKVTCQGNTHWLNEDLNHGRLDFYYYLLAALTNMNLFYICYCVRGYHYRPIANPEIRTVP